MRAQLFYSRYMRVIAMESWAPLCRLAHAAGSSSSNTRARIPACSFPHLIFIFIFDCFICSSLSFSLFFHPLFLRTPLIHRIFIDPCVLILAVFLQRSFGPHASCLFQGCWGPFPGGVFFYTSVPLLSILHHRRSSSSILPLFPRGGGVHHFLAR